MSKDYANWNVSIHGRIRSTTEYAEDAAAMVAALGDEATLAHRSVPTLTLWHEGHESQPAAESYDHVAQVAYDRLGRRAA